MESPVSYSRVLHKHSLLVMKHGRSGYEPSDTETELNEPPWKEFTKKTLQDSLILTRRHSSKFDPEGLPPPRRHSKSPYKTRRGDGNSRSPTPGPLPLPPGRSVSPFSKSERRRRVSSFIPARDDHLSDNDEESDASYKPMHRLFDNEKPSYARTLSAPRLRSRDKDQQLKSDQQLKRREGRSRTPPSRRSVTPRKDREGSHKSTPSVVEVVANAKLVKSPVRRSPIYDSTDSLPGGDVVVSRDVVSAQKIKNEGLENRVSPELKMFIQKKPIPLQRNKSNPITNCKTMVCSRQSSNLSDTNGKSNGSSRRFTANRRKSQTDSWFSCIGKKSCGTNKKSPERLRAFDEASFIEKAFVVENLRQFWADKYQPTSLDGFTCHKQQALQLKQLASQDIFPHILLKGPRGSGKKALTMALLCEIYGDTARNISHDLRYFQIQETRLTQVAVPVTSSSHHVELNVHLEANAKYVLMASVKQTSSSDNAVTTEISTANLKPDYTGTLLLMLILNKRSNFIFVFRDPVVIPTVMVLYDVDKADESIQNLIKWIMDCYSDVCKLVLCCQDDVNVLESVKTRCHIIKLDAPVTQEISRKEDFDLSMKFAAKIANKSKHNLRKAIMALEACKCHKLFITREKLQKLLVEFVHPKLILLKLIEQLLKGVEANIKRELYYWHGYYVKFRSIYHNYMLFLANNILRIVNANIQDKRLPVGTSALLKLEGNKDS
ncbi:putative P-loop containing nucleoside triphosphate hydrolase [Helianthus annuus]|uniref:P-loop containing nucleoside triphosphate hydrolase n=1 Tax=Helianthus annuus TaxID=4232 RepID=A0A251TWL0_HELAN|nr:putative P-loop containing nucleoside triphosphate hydrolase [Helianthus annuus]KAJ0534852.1 putative P-loop containing nucleoside triphosphate hydrolase [Helianthus annuus]KAJ0888738.1 putative P-loop containing nucleoside triphosphate hydrolase [Helianthus annuus]KAJ0893594.1 putative P-loop containing nucleoside triphosphate hydrolase [Helianthus annuus]